LHSAATLGERFILLRGRRPVAELRPIPSGRLLGELEAVLRSLPALTPAEAEDYAADIEEARARLPQDEPRDPWQS
jgi:hypothetical protein